MRLSENKLLRGYSGWTHGGHITSAVDEARIWWSYRKLDEFGRGCICHRGDADIITIEHGPGGEVTDIPMAKRLTKAEAEQLGNIEHDYSVLFPA